MKGWLFYWKILFYSFRRNWRQVLLSSLGIFIGIFFYLTVNSGTEGINRVVRNRLIGDLPINTVRAHIPGKGAGLEAVWGGARDPISHGLVKKALALEGVKNIEYTQTLHRRASLAFPLPKPDAPKKVLEDLGNIVSGITDIFGGEAQTETKPQKKPQPGGDKKAPTGKNSPAQNGQTPGTQAETKNGANKTQASQPGDQSSNTKSSTSAKPAGQKKPALKTTPPTKEEQNYLYFDMVLVGISPGLAREGLRNTKYFGPDKKGRWPLLIPQPIIDLFTAYLNQNKTPTKGFLPDFSGKDFPTVDLKLNIGYSVGMQSGAVEDTYDLRLAGVLPGGQVMGLAVPLKLVRKLNGQKNKSSAWYYKELFIETESNEVIPQVTKKLEALGLTVESSSEIAKRASRTMRLVKRFFQGIVFLFLLISGISIFNSFLLIITRLRKEIALFRFLGASKIYISSLYLVQAAIVGALHGALAFAGAGYLVDYLNKKIVEWVPVLPLGPGENLFILEGDLLTPVVLTAAGAAAASALIPAILTTRSKILYSLRK